MNGYNKFNGPGTVALDSAGASDAYLIKLDPSMTLSYARRFGSQQNDSATSLAIDANNNLYMTGIESGQSSFGTTGAGTMVLNTGNGMTNVANAYVLEVDNTGGFVQARGAGGSGQTGASGIAVNGAGQVAVTGFYTGSVSFGNTSLGTLGATQNFVAHMGTSNGTGSTPGGGGTNGGGTNGGGTNGGGTNGGGTTTPPTMVAPSFVNATRIVVGHGRHQKVVGFTLNFTAALHAADAQNVAHYQVTQRIKRGRMSAVPVRAATISPAGNSVSLVLGAVNKTKPLQLMATGLSGANGTTVAPVITTLF